MGGGRKPKPLRLIADDGGGEERRPLPFLPSSQSHFAGAGFRRGPPDGGAKLGGGGAARLVDATFRGSGSTPPRRGGAQSRAENRLT